MRNLRKPLIIVLVVLVLLAGLTAVLSLGNNTANSESTPTPAQQITVTPTAVPGGDETGDDTGVNSPPPAQEPEPTPIDSPDGASEGSVVGMLNELKVAPEQNTGSYNRGLFPHWSSVNGCNTRVVVLARDGVDTSVSGCKVSGTWVSVYSGVSSTDPGSFDIDHMVPLKEAWVSGAYGWDTATREAYANDLVYPYSLVAVDASSNRSKSDKDPAEWLPSTMDACDYVGRWVGVKHRWGLTVDEVEKGKILSVLSWCGGDYVLPAVPPVAKVETAPVNPDPVVPPVVGETVPGAEDPKFKSCAEAKRNGFKGPYIKGTDVEYEWYEDRDNDGMVCE